ncbi:DNA polymerase III subunit gamma and tau [Myceligenerans indicum]|uniref:DNA-directed DNA polymerase n=1 Tax=Myceligenerans indicum TaxID=2593663 RepID=A0ABS1LLU5_9MICO|nr:DNA polymerase III subunit gamma and tau [Myceligenerans indicum]MBL0887245.1 DNA polymerase III subunit gamma and tau [Myceligenerans indicum]
MTTALYRRYRPDTFAEMIGQEHVTGPLMQALRSGRVNHAYLFSGPRGCGKTTSARILARTLNCHRNTPETPLDTPCGECDSCVELARGGPGSLDVVEIDAASHNGVDDARDLRERATFAPARDRYKIFILDEAHMVTPQGFNALLKIVEEPPPHIKFVFATTEPDKVIGTIRSRTHHYPFRLVPPDVLSPYLEKLADSEGIQVGAGVLPLVTRAGGGSVRDSLSVMDQLIAGASGGEVGYDLAVGLLGYTHSSLLDDVVDALAARDGASIFRVVDQIIATGHEPRRFVEDVLERLRDLIVIGVSGDAADAVLRELPTDQLERMHAQAGRLGVAELSRAADLVNAALTEMTGATSPRLHLELLCARLLLPGADDGTAGLAARIDRLERGGIAARAAGASVTEPAAEPAAAEGSGGGLSGAAAARAVIEANRAKKNVQTGGTTPSGGSGAATNSREMNGDGTKQPDSSAEPRVSGPSQAAPVPTSTESVASRTQQAVQEDRAVHPPAAAPAADVPAAEAPATDAPAEQAPRPSEGAPSPRSEQHPASPSSGAMTTEEVRRRWPEVLETLSAARVTWSLVGQNAQVAALDGAVLKLAFRADGLARAFSNPRHTNAVEDAVYQTLGVQVKVEGIVGDGPGPGAAGPGGNPGPGGGAGPGGNTGPGGGAGPDRAPDEAGEPGVGSGPGGGTSGRAGQNGSTGPGAQASTDSTDSGQSPRDSAPEATASTTPAAEPDGWPTVPVPGARSGTATTASAAPSRNQPTESAPLSPGSQPSRAEPAGPPGGVAAQKPVGAAAVAVAVAERPATAPASSTATATPPDDEPIPEPPPDYDDDLEPGGDRTPSPPPVPESVYATQGSPGRLTGAERAREALRRAQAARNPDAAGAATASTGPSGTSASPVGRAATYDELSADDPDLETGGNGLVGVPLVVKVLGGTVIDEKVDQA